MMFLGYGLIVLFSQKSHDEGIVFEQSQTESSLKNESSPKSGKQITIDIEGAVQKPGIYKLSSESRVHDALIVAGGMSKDADRQKIAQGLNLAAPLTDGAKLYIPFVGEQMAGSTVSLAVGREVDRQYLEVLLPLILIKQVSQN